VTFNQLLFDIPIQLINFGSNLFDLLTGQPTEAAPDWQRTSADWPAGCRRTSADCSAQRQRPFRTGT